MKFSNIAFSIVACCFNILICFQNIKASDLPNNTDPVVEVSQGKLQGKIAESRNGKPYYKFLGIPYGKIPLRFQVAEPGDKWNGIKSARKAGAACPQIDISGGVKIRGEEDCLFLNVYTPKLPNLNDTIQPLPVLVFVHDGGFGNSWGDLNGPKYIMDQQDIILVTVNYRFGVFGFLNAGVKGASGNQGLKDIILSLKWIKENINKFGGDSKRIVATGEGAGAWAVAYLTISPMAKGLVSGVISQSGSALMPYAALTHDPLSEARKVAHAVDCPSSNVEYMLTCLRKIKTEDLVALGKFYSPMSLEDPDQSIHMFPTLETYQDRPDDPNVFLSEDPYTLLSEGRINKIPVIIGGSSQEGSIALGLLKNETALKKLNEEWGRVVPWFLLYEKSTKDPCKVSSKIKEFYFQNEDVRKDNEEELSNLMADRYMFHGIRTTGRLLAKHVPVYLYNFTYMETNSSTKDATSDGSLSDVKKTVAFPNTKPGSVNEKFSNLFIKLWTSFAKNGKPTDLGSSVTEWKAIDSDDKHPKWLQIDEELQMKQETSDFSARMEFWDGLHLKELNKNHKMYLIY